MTPSDNGGSSYAASQLAAAILASTRDAIVSIDNEGKIIGWNPGAEALFGYGSAEVMGEPCARVVVGDFQVDEEAFLAKLHRGEQIGPEEVWLDARDGRRVSASLTILPLTDEGGRTCGAVKVIRDISQAATREQGVRREAQLYAALSGLKRAIMEPSTREEMLQAACRTLVEVAGMALAWVGMHAPGTDLLEPVATWGEAGAYPQRIRVHGGDVCEGQGPSGRAYRSGSIEICDDTFADPRMAPWQDALRANGLRASVALPIRERGQVCGVLSVYATDAGFFGQDEIRLLEEAASDISFGLEHRANAEDAQRAVAALEAANRFSSALMEGLPGTLLVFDEEMRAVRWNAELVRRSGYSPQELAGLHPLDLTPPTERARARQVVLSAIESGHGSMEAGLLAKDGTETRFWYTGSRAMLEGRPCLVVVGIDISDRVAAQEAERRSLGQWRAIFENAGLGICVVSVDEGRLLQVNEALARMFHEPFDAVQGRLMHEFLVPDVPEWREQRRRLLHGEIERFQLERPFHLKDGSTLWAAVTATVVNDAGGRPEYAICMFEDRTERRREEQRTARMNRVHSVIARVHSAMLRGESRHALLSEACDIASGDGVYLVAIALEVGADGETPEPVAERGVSIEVLQLGLASIGRIPPEHRLGWRAVRLGRPVISNDLLADDAFPTVRESLRASRLRAGVGLPLWTAGKVSAALVLLADEAGTFGIEEMQVLEWFARDLSYALDHLATRDKLRRLTHFDALTGLLNARAFTAEVQRLAMAAEASGQSLSLVLVELVDFSGVNRRFGYEIGDELLRQIAERMRTTMDARCALGHIGGGTFGAACLLDAATAGEQVGERMLTVFGYPFMMAGNPVAPEVRAGALLAEAGSELLTSGVDVNRLRQALKQGHVEGRQIVPLAAWAGAGGRMPISLEAQLQEAIRSDQLVLAYQPRVDMRSGEIVAVEALVRWQHPERGLLQPVEFIRLAERSGLILALGNWVLRRACAQQAAWRQEGLATVPVSINVSSIQLGQDDLFDLVKEALASHGLEPGSIELELTESAVMEDMVRSVEMLERLRACGIGLTLDDFGTGYSSLSYLKRMPFHRVNIDRSFVMDIISSVEDAVIAEAIIAIAHTLRLKVVAEGVETEAQFNYLKERHCDEMQGNYFSPPLDADALGAMLRSGRKLALAAAGEDAGRTLLIVDDEVGICRALSRLLRRDGYNIVTASSAAEALEKLALQPVQVIISDQRMPGVSGTELLDKVKVLYPDTMRLILSGYTDLKVVTEAVNRGAVFKFLTKPWDDELLRGQIRDAFARYRPGLRN